MADNTVLATWMNKIVVSVYFLSDGGSDSLQSITKARLCQVTMYNKSIHSRLLQLSSNAIFI